MARNPLPRRAPRWLRIARYAFLFGLLFLVLFGYQVVRLITDWQWFGELGQPGVYTGILSARLTLFFGFGLLFFLVCYFNFWYAQRMNATRPRPRLLDIERQQFNEMLQRASGFIAFGVTLLLAFLIGGNSAGHWNDYLLFTHAQSFDQTDPIFRNDISFYIFRLPFWSFVQNWLLITLFVTLAGTAVVYASNRAIDFVAGSIPTFENFVRRHLLILLGAFALTVAWGTWLSRYNILTHDNGAFFGAGYTDVHVRLPALTVQAVVMALVGVLCFVNVNAGRAFRLPLAGLAVWIVVMLLGTGVLPSFVQRFTVVPNQFAKEERYIEHDITFTRQAYGLDRVKVQDLPGAGTVTAASVQANRTTIDNIRLWDWPQLGAVYQVKQTFRSYYRFQLPPNTPMTSGDFNIDVDRYRFGNDYRQVMLGARELYPEGLPPQAQTWQNQRLQYTHGYGTVMSPVNRADREGLPEYFMSEMPVQTTRPELKLTHPQIYYGELTNQHVFVGSQQNEFDFPSTQGNEEKTTRYGGKGGVSVGGSLNRLLWSARLGDSNMFLSSELTAQSRVLFRRNIRERVQALAPFLNWDNDPYMVVSDGRLVWMMDGYTATDNYPYSKPFEVGTGVPGVEQTFNYIRNSVKAVVDAYDGTVQLYTADAADPIIRTWSRIFPRLFKPLEAMPENLRNHIRYPEDLFRIQRDIYTIYHVTDTRTYYTRDDAWSVPLDPTSQSDEQAASRFGSAAQRMMPYYVVMRLPGEKKEEFLMMTPFTPQSRDNSVQNLAAWMAAKCEPEDYGEITVYRFPKGTTVNGPQQVMSLVVKDPKISQFQTLLGQRGSKVIFGNLLIIPVENSLLYAIPVYVQGSGQGTYPGLTQVILSSGNEVVMEPTLERALVALTDGTTQVAGTGTGPTAGQRPTTGAGDRGQGTGDRPTTDDRRPTTTGALPSATPQELLTRASRAFERARQKQKEYDQALDELGGALKEMERGMSGPKRP